LGWRHTSRRHSDAKRKNLARLDTAPHSTTKSAPDWAAKERLLARTGFAGIQQGRLFLRQCDGLERIAKWLTPTVLVGLRSLLRPSSAKIVNLYDTRSIDPSDNG